MRRFNSDPRLQAPSANRQLDLFSSQRELAMVVENGDEGVQIAGVTRRGIAFCGRKNSAQKFWRLHSGTWIATRHWHGDCEVIRAMKTQNRNQLLPLLSVAIALAMPLFAHAAAPVVNSPVPAPLASDTNVSGKITTKSDTAVTVDDKTFTVNGATSITKGGAKMKLEDLKVGDTVSVTATKADGGQMLAVSIEVSK